MKYYQVKVRERIGFEYYTSEYTGSLFTSKDEALNELMDARDDFANDLYAEPFLCEIEGNEVLA